MANLFRTAALLAWFLAGLLLADVALGQTFTYSRGWKPNGKRSRASALPVLPPPPPLPPGPRASAAVGSLLGPAGHPSYLDDAVLEDQPVRYLVEALSGRWAPFDAAAQWRAPGPAQDDVQILAEREERYRRAEPTTQAEHDDH